MIGELFPVQQYLKAHVLFVVAIPEPRPERLRWCDYLQATELYLPIVDLATYGKVISLSFRGLACKEQRWTVDGKYDESTLRKVGNGRND